MNAQWLCGKWQTINRQAKVIIFKYDCSYAYIDLGAPFFPRDMRRICMFLLKGNCHVVFWLIYAYDENITIRKA